MQEEVVCAKPPGGFVALKFCMAPHSLPREEYHAETALSTPGYDRKLRIRPASTKKLLDRYLHGYPLSVTSVLRTASMTLEDRTGEM